MFRILLRFSLVSFLTLISSFANSEMFKANCMDEGDLTKTEYKMFQLKVNRDKGKLKWGDDDWVSFQEGGDYIHWNTLTPVRGMSINYFFNNKKRMIIATEFAFEPMDRNGKQGLNSKYIYNCF